MSQKKILITGAEGFIAKNLANFLSRKGFKIFGIGNKKYNKKISEKFGYQFLSNKKINKVLEYNLIINWEDDGVALKTILEGLEQKLQTFKLVRYDWSNSAKSASLIIEPENDFGIDDLIEQLKKQAPSINVTFFEAKTNW